VSEAGFKIEEETLQLIIRHFKEVRNDMRVGQEELKTDISAVTTGQGELKTDMKTEISAVKNDIEDRIQISISTVKDDISIMATKINAGQEEARQETSAFQERIKAGQAQLEESVKFT
jgi:hypothetical protein